MITEEQLQGLACLGMVAFIICLIVAAIFKSIIVLSIAIFIGGSVLLLAMVMLVKVGIEALRDG